MSPKTRTQKSASRSTASNKKSKGFTADERAAMKERVKELKGGTNETEGEGAVFAKIAQMPEPDRSMAKRIHAIVMSSAPELSPRTWYGMPAYSKNDKVVCFFKNAAKFKARYAELGFNDAANLDEGAMWPTVFAVRELNAAGEAKISALVKKAVS